MNANAFDGGFLCGQWAKRESGRFRMAKMLGRDSTRMTLPPPNEDRRQPKIKIKSFQSNLQEQNCNKIKEIKCKVRDEVVRYESSVTCHLHIHPCCFQFVSESILQ